jgi:hypothetical protein
MSTSPEVHAASSSSSSSSSDLRPETPKQLQRRLNGISLTNWSMRNNLELLSSMMQWPNLSEIDTVSSSIFKMTQHIRTWPIDGQMNMLLMSGSSPICGVLGPALQQLGDSIQQHLQTGQLPAVLTARAVDACAVLCQVLVKICKTAERIVSFSTEDGDSKFREAFYVQECETGGLTRVLIHVPQLLCVSDAGAHL